MQKTLNSTETERVTQGLEAITLDIHRHLGRILAGKLELKIEDHCQLRITTLDLECMRIEMTK